MVSAIGTYLPSKPVNCWATKNGCDRKFWSFRAHDVHFVGTLRDLREDRHAIRLHFGEAERDHEVVNLLALAVPEVTDLQQREQRRVTREDAEVAVGARDLHLVHLLVHEQVVRRDDLERDVTGDSGGCHVSYAAFIFSASWRTSSIVPRM